LLVSHKTRSYAYAPNYSGEIRTDEYRVAIMTNELGLRDDRIAITSDQTRILAVGDSFTVGFGVEAEDAWPARLQSALNSDQERSQPVRVMNAGVSGYNARQIADAVQEYFGKLSPELVVLGLYPSRYWRLDDPYVLLNGHTVLSSKLPCLRAVGDGVVCSKFEGDILRRIDFFLAEYFIAGFYALDLYSRAREKYRRLEDPPAPGGNAAPVPPARRLRRLLDEIKSMHDYVTAQDAAFVVMLINEQAADGTYWRQKEIFNGIVTSFCEARGIAVLDLLPIFKRAAGGAPIFRIGRDHHWSKAAHALAGRELAGFVVRQGLIRN
jgi:lysophospholipase L1-like esterase